MNGLDWLTEDIINNTNNKIRNTLQSIAKSEKYNVQKERCRIISEWTKDFSGQDFHAISNNQVTVTFTANNLKGNVCFDTWTETDFLENHKSADRWISKWGGEKSSNEYVADLIFDHGIIGLPEYANSYKQRTGEEYNGSGWKDGYNLFFRQKESLTSWIQNEDNWNKFMDKMEDKIYKKLNDERG